MTHERLASEHEGYKNNHQSASSKTARMSSHMHTNMFLKASSKLNRNTQSKTPKGQSDVCNTDHSLSALQPSRVHLSQSDDESVEPLNSILDKKKQHRPEQDKCTIGSTDNINGTTLSNMPPSYESIAKDSKNSAVKR